MTRVQLASLEWALRHVERHGDTDVFPEAFEYAAIRADWPAISSFLLRVDVSSWPVRAKRRALAPKGQLGFRVVTQLDPLDTLLFLSLVKEVAPDIEAYRSDEAKASVFGWRYVDSPVDLFSRTLGHERFQRATDSILAAQQDVEWVAVTDISDFFPRIYHHRLENALRAMTARGEIVTAIMRFLGQWTDRESFGLPVGGSAARLLADAHLVEVDELLLAQGIRFLRYADDYRVFARTEHEAYEGLAFLADALHSTRGLTLQREKTKLLMRAAFRNRYLIRPEIREQTALRERFDKFLAQIGVTDPYEAIDSAELSDEDLATLRSLNLRELLVDAIDEEDPDLTLVRWLIRRMGQLGDGSAIDALLGAVDRIYPAFPDVVRYLLSIDFTAAERRALGERLVGLLETPYIGALDYNCMWALVPFGRSQDWNQVPRLLAETGGNEPLVRRKAILALGRAQARAWFQSQRGTVFDASPWHRRAMIAGASCLEEDGLRHWYASLRSRLDPLERAVADWARANPFHP